MDSKKLIWRSWGLDLFLRRLQDIISPGSEMLP
jgi:hypothetical protein